MFAFLLALNHIYHPIMAKQIVKDIIKIKHVIKPVHILCATICHYWRIKTFSYSNLFPLKMCQLLNVSVIKLDLTIDTPNKYNLHSYTHVTLLLTYSGVPQT